MHDDPNPFLGLAIDAAPPASGGFRLGPLRFGAAPVRPNVLMDLAAGRGTLKALARESTGFVPAVVFDYAPSAASTPQDLAPIPATFAAFEVPGVPVINIIPRPLIALLPSVVRFDARPVMTKRFIVLCDDESAARRALATKVLEAIEALPDSGRWHLESGAGWLLASPGTVAGGSRATLVRDVGRVAAAMKEALRATTGTDH